ncbi:MAG TPA: PilZ domain-containing protein [Acidimicrobiales bacterium]|nr:PilZ domain-containing protein [Acidimicrobiales bacterium]
MAKAQQSGTAGPETGTGDPLEPGVRVSLELPEAGTCVGVVASKDEASVVLELLDDVPDGELETGATLELFMPGPHGMYHWICTLRSLPGSQRAELELVSAPVFVQRRLRPRVEAGLQARVRRIHSSRRGTAHDMKVADLSRGGMKLEGPFQVSTGDTLEVTVDLGPQVQLTGRAVMAYPSGPARWAAHVSFLDGQREAIDSIDAYIASRMRHY